MSSTAYKLIHFDGRGDAEAARYLLKYGNIEFEDVRVTREDWPKLKASTPFGQLPLLTHNGKQVNQSQAICRYLARLVKLNGKDDWENLEIDATVDTISDMSFKVKRIFSEQNPDKKKALMETAKNEIIPFYMEGLEKQAQKNDGYLVGGKITWVDFRLAVIAERINYYFCFSFDAYPTLQALIAKVEALPAIREWIAERPTEH